MARILVLGVKVPFTSGGQEVLARCLLNEIRARGHQVDSVELPFSMLPKERLLGEAARWRSLDLEEIAGNKIDLVIATKFPSYYVRHSRKSLWLVHQHRPLYDLYGTRYSDFGDDARDEALRRQLVEGDDLVLKECAYRAAISRNVAQRLKRFNNLDCEVLYPPLPAGDKYYSKPAEDYILSVGRLCSIKRVDLMIKAMPSVKAPLSLKIVGQADEPGVMEYFQNEIAKHNLAQRIEFLGRVGDQELLELYAKSLCVYYAPHDEDYGYVTLEAMASAKPVVCCHDSGGVLEFIDDQQTGLVVAPEPEAIAAAVNRLSADRGLAQNLGLSARSFIDKHPELSAGWDNLIARLLSPLEA